MKTALLLYGHMRTYRQCFPFLQANLLDAVQPDVFLHTWDETEPRTRTWHNRQGEPAALDAAAVRAVYRPAAMAIETQPPVSDTRVTPNNNMSYDGQKFMLYSLQQACALKRAHEAAGGFEYDVVIKLRPDIKLIAPLRFDKPYGDEIWIASNLRPDSDRTACDIINIAMSNTMNRICNVYEQFDQFYVHNFNAGKVEHSGFVDYVKSLGLRVRYLDYHYGKQWTIVRGKPDESAVAVAGFRQRMIGHLDDQIKGERHGQPDREIFHAQRQGADNANSK